MSTVNQLKRFHVISASDAADGKFQGQTGSPSVTRRRFQPHQVTNMPAICFGDTSLAPDDLESDQLRSGWQVPIGPVDEFLIRNAVVSHTYGFITVGDFLIRETLYHAPFHLLEGAGYVGDEWCDLPVGAVAATIQSGYHMMACNQSNYYHWMLDVVARFNPDLGFPLSPFDKTWSNTVLLTPERSAGYKKETVDAICAPNLPCLEVLGSGAIKVEELRFSGPTMYPHSGISRVFDTLMLRLYQTSSAIEEKRFNKRIYVSRSDASNRRMDNESAVIQLVREAGFECVTLSEMSVWQQAQLFSQATHIIGPHGAGLTNLLFCRPETKFCELQMNTYSHWGFRHIAGLRGIRYGCIFGGMNEPRHDWIHANSWTLPIQFVEELLRDERFLS